MGHHYRFRVHRLPDTAQPLFQLRVGMEGERDFELLPVHRTAFAEQMDLEPAHATLAEVQLELSSLLHWLELRAAAVTIPGLSPDEDGLEAA